MPKGLGKERKLIAVPSELVRQLNLAANREGTPFYDYTVEALEQAVRASRLKRTIRQIVDFYTVMEVRKASGHILIPRDTLNQLIKKLYPKDRDALKNVWLEAGSWFGMFLAAKIHDHEAVDFFIKMLKTSEWQLDEVSFKEKDDAAKLRLTSFTLPKENTELLMNYVVGVMKSLGYKAEKTELMRGMISLELKKK